MRIPRELTASSVLQTVLPALSPHSVPLRLALQTCLPHRNGDLLAAGKVNAESEIPSLLKNVALFIPLCYIELFVLFWI